MISFKKNKAVNNIFVLFIVPKVSYVDDGDNEDNAGLVDMYGNNVRVPRRIESYPGNNIY